MPVVHQGAHYVTQLGQDACPLLIVRGIAVDEQRLATGGRDARLDLFDVGHALAPIQMHAADVVARLGEGHGRRLAKAAARAQDQRPWLAVVCVRHVFSRLPVVDRWVGRV